VDVICFAWNYRGDEHDKGLYPDETIPKPLNHSMQTIPSSQAFQRFLLVRWKKKLNFGNEEKQESKVPFGTFQF
jgi:hypothetical protein